MIIMDTGHSDLLHLKPYERLRVAGFGWWHVVSLVTREGAAVMLDMPSVRDRPHVATSVPVVQVPVVGPEQAYRSPLAALLGYDPAGM
jgi:hypothetical protein